MNIKNLLVAVVVALFVVVTPAAAFQPIFSDGFESGSTCAWSPASCLVPTLVGTDAEVDGSVASYTVNWRAENFYATPVYQSKLMCRGLASTACGVSFTIRNSEGDVYTGGVTVVQLAATNSALDSSTHWGMAGNGASRTFWAFIGLNNSGGTVGFYRARVEGVSFAFDANDHVGDYISNIGFQTNSVNVGNSLMLTEQTEALLDALPYPLWTPGVETFMETSPGVLERVTW